MLRVLE